MSPGVGAGKAGADGGWADDRESYEFGATHYLSPRMRSPGSAPRTSTAPCHGADRRGYHCEVGRDPARPGCKTLASPALPQSSLLGCEGSVGPKRLTLAARTAGEPCGEPSSADIRLYRADLSVRIPGINRHEATVSHVRRRQGSRSHRGGHEVQGCGGQSLACAGQRRMTATTCGQRRQP